jgi:hypothetical protein
MEAGVGSATNQGGFVSAPITEVAPRPYNPPAHHNVSLAPGARLGGPIVPGAPRGLFQTGLAADPLTEPYAVTPDGSRFLVMRPLAERPTSLSFSGILNWPSLVDRR